jgi:isoleucyl-tRNA synthetase
MAAKSAKELLKASLNLPKTKFPMRANAVKRELELNKRTTQQLYDWQLQSRKGGERGDFILHDGPPYANGDLHMGHLLNKTLKDIINRHKLMSGYRIKYVPGWDCHGLPIELKALESLKTNDRHSLSPMEIRKIACELADMTIGRQAKDFERWGVMGDWSGKKGSFYATKEPSYEANQIGVFWHMVEAGLIYKGRKPVYWSPSSQTALAEAELEYADDHVSTSVYIRFNVSSFVAGSTAESELSSFDDLALVIWTTTPWTIPANMALCVNPEFEYSILKLKQPSPSAAHGGHLIVATELLADFEREVASKDEGEAGSGSQFEVCATIPGAELGGILCLHPFATELADGARRKRTSVVMAADHVTALAGTGVVHTAPAHGIEDFDAWREYTAGMSDVPSIIVPVDEKGAFTEVADEHDEHGVDGGTKFEGMLVLEEGTSAVVDKLHECGALLNGPHGTRFKHRYAAREEQENERLRIARVLAKRKKARERESERARESPQRAKATARSSDDKKFLSPTAQNVHREGHRMYNQLSNLRISASVVERACRRKSK